MSEQSETNVRGSGRCHCGQVVFEVPKKLGGYFRCYCQTCQKLTGSAFAAVARVDSDKFSLLKGEEHLSSYESTPGKKRYHCSTCHAAVYVELDSAPEIKRIRLGVLDFEPNTSLVAHIFVAEKSDWYDIHDSAPQHKGWPT